MPVLNSGESDGSEGECSTVYLSFPLQRIIIDLPTCIVDYTVYTQRVVSWRPKISAYVDIALIIVHTRSPFTLIVADE